MEETFTLTPLTLNPESKTISTTLSSQAIRDEIEALNSMHKLLLSLESPHQVPPPPLPVNPKRSVAIQKMREQGNAQLSKRHGNAGGPPPQENIKESLKLYTYALSMAGSRPSWEPAQIFREENAILYSNRAQSYIGLQDWPSAAADAEVSVECKAAPGQGKAWWRWARSLLEMGRIEESREVVLKALEVEGANESPELQNLLTEIGVREARRNEREKAKRAGK